MTKIKNKASYFIGLDIGTSALKGVLTDSRGTVLAEVGAENHLLHPQEGWVEMDPEEHYRNVCQILRKLADATPGEVTAVAMAAASGNVLLSGPDGSPLGNIISWMDSRAAQQPPAALVGLDAGDVAQIVGWPCVTNFPLAQLAWLSENQSELFCSAAHIGMDTDWLLYRLTGEWKMDHSTATTFHLQNQSTGTYYAPYLEKLGIAQEKLSALIPSGEIVGRLSSQAVADTGLSERTVVVSGCFDHPAAARATGVLKPGELMLSCGTSWVGFIPHSDRNAIVEAGLLCDPFLSDRDGPWAGMFSVPKIGRNIDWYVENVIALGEKVSERMRAFDSMAAKAEPGAGGLHIDLREKPKQIDADRVNVSRAVMEGAARLLNERILELAEYGFCYSRAVMVGGPSRSPVWPGIVAEITGLDVTAGDRSAGARGAAMLAAEGVGFRGLMLE
ncbi:MAG: FGGY family carbohydrate kinase [Kiritimatiellae bacterium]|nr:FGGY family carbohydrate kinase [Kiritimatiellia bacterium]